MRTNAPRTEPAQGQSGNESGVWATIREALRGSRQDFTEVPIGRATFLLAVPMVMEMVMESLFAVVDIFWVSKLGADAVATVGLTESILAIIYAVALGLSTAATAIVARRTGEKNPDGAAVAAVQVIMVSILASIAIGVGGVLFGPRVLALMGASPSVVEMGSSYAVLMLGGNATIVLLFVLNAIFRGAGDAATAMRSLWLANILNMALGPCFIFGIGPLPEMGVVGAAIATNLGRGIGVAYQLLVLTRGSGRVTVLRRHVRAHSEVMIGLLRVAGNGTLQMLVETTSWLGLVRILSDFGSTALAGYTIAIRVAVFALLPSWGMANAAATLVGQNLGAGKPDRAERSVWVGGLYNFVFLETVGIGFFALSEPIVRFFTAEAGCVLWSRLPSYCGARLHLFRLRHGDGASIQWRGRYQNTDVPQPCLFLAVQDSCRLCPRRASRTWATWRLHGHYRCLCSGGSRRCPPVPSRPVERKASLTASHRFSNVCRP